MYFNKENLARSEGAYLIKKEDVLQNNIKHCGLSYFFLAQINEDDKKFKLYDEVKLLKELDFSYLTPPVEIYKELIELYLSHMRNTEVKMFQTKLQALQQENSSLKNNLSSQEHKEKNLKLQGLELKLKSKENKITKQVLKNKILEKELGFTHKDILENKILNQKVKELENLLSSIQSPQVNIHTSAKLRVQKHLAYKLGQALIENSKSIKGYIRLPYVLSYIKDKHKAEQKAYNEKILKNPSLKLPSLDSYQDYEAALKEKECLTYRLGEALMKANKEWYKGGYIKFYFESKRLRKEFKKRKLAR